MPPKDFKPNNYSKEEKENISKEMKNITREEVLKDFAKLKNIGGDAENRCFSNIGNMVVDKYTFINRLETKDARGINFFDLYYNRNLLTQPFVLKILDYYKTNPENANVKNWYAIMRLYFQSVNIFKPLVAMEVYWKYKPKTILDFTMGWGGRMVGACALNIEKYIGIDNNQNLEVPYRELKELMNDVCTTKIELHFTDAVNFDYSKLKYDMVLTSPPYYNLEQYEGQIKKTKKEWDENFYIPLFKNTFDNMEIGGFYCINIPQEIYSRIALKLFGEPTNLIELKRNRRSKKEKYKEFIYIWEKK